MHRRKFVTNSILAGLLVAVKPAASALSASIFPVVQQKPADIWDFNVKELPEFFEEVDEAPETSKVRWTVILHPGRDGYGTFGAPYETAPSDNKVLRYAYSIETDLDLVNASCGNSTGENLRKGTIVTIDYFKDNHVEVKETTYIYDPQGKRAEHIVVEYNTHRGNIVVSANGKKAELTNTIQISNQGDVVINGASQNESLFSLDPSTAAALASYKEGILSTFDDSVALLLLKDAGYSLPDARANANIFEYQLAADDILNKSGWKPGKGPMLPPPPVLYGPFMKARREAKNIRGAARQLWQLVIR